MTSVDFIVVAFRNLPSEVESLTTTLVSTAAACGFAAGAVVVANDDSLASEPNGLADRPDHLIIHGQGNVGFAAGVSLGVRESSADYVVFVNPDCEISAADLTRFLHHLTPDCGVVVPRLLGDDGKFDYRPYENWTISIGRKYSEVRCRRQLAKSTRESLPRYAKIPGAFVGMSREMAIRFDGPFDRAFFLYAEDRDLTDRVRSAGVPIRFVRDVEVLHPGGASGVSVNSLVETAKTDGSMRVAFRRYGRLGAIVFAADVLVVDLIKRALRRPTAAAAHRSALRIWQSNRFRDPGALRFGTNQEVLHEADFMRKREATV